MRRVVWVARANACSAPRTSLKTGSERFVVRRKERRKERAASRAGQPAFSIACMALPGQARFRGASMGRVDWAHARTQSSRQMLLDGKGVV